MVQTPDQGKEFQVVNNALTKVPRPHLTGMVLGKDIKLGDLQLNAIDDNNVVWVCTDIGGWWNLPDVEVLDLDKGWGDGSFQSKGRYRTRILELEGVILPPNASKVQTARDTLVRAIDLVRDTTWLVVNEADYTKAVKVRLSGKPKIENVNARGRIEFSIGLVAVDPVKYQWFGDSTTTDYAETQPKNSTGTQDGYVTINNKGNYPVGAVYEIEGPIVSGGATIFNETTGDLMTITDTTRGKMYRYANVKSMANGDATLTVTAKHDLSVGDEVEISLPQNFSVTGLTVSSGVATFTANATHNFAVGDVFAVSNVHANVNGVELIVTGAPAHNTFNAATTSTNITVTPDSTATVENITNKKLNGTFPVANVVNSYSFTYSTTYNDSITNVAQTSNNSSPTVFRDADILEIDTTNREVAFNGDATQKRGMLASVVDWVKLGKGNNIVQFDDSDSETFYIYRYRVQNNVPTGADTITLYTTKEHGYTTSDSITISNVSSNVNTDLTKPINTYSSSANVVTLNVTAHGYSTDNYVVVSGLSKDIDGLRSVTNVNANAISFTANGAGTFYTTNAPSNSTTRKVSKVTSYSRTNNVVTVIANSHGFLSNDSVFFTGLSNVVDGLFIITKVDANTVTYATRTSGNVSSTNTANGYAAVRYQVSDTDDFRIVYVRYPNTASAVSNTEIGAIASTDVVGEIAVASVSANNDTKLVTVTTHGEHGFSVGESASVLSINSSSSVMDKYAVSEGRSRQIVNWNRATDGVVGINVETNTTSLTYSVDNFIRISDLDPSVDGTYTLSGAPDNINLTFTTSNSTFVSTIQPDNARVQRLHKINFYYRNNGGTNTVGNVVSYTQTSSPNVEITSGISSNVAVGHKIVLYGVKNELDGRELSVVAIDSANNKFTVNAIYTATDSNLSSTGTWYNANVDNSLSSTVGNVVYVSTDTAHGLLTGDSVSISGLSSSIDGTQRVIYVNSNLFSYIVDSTASKTRKNVTSFTRSSGSSIVTVVTPNNHEFSVGDYIYVEAGDNTMDGQRTMYSNVNAKAFTFVSDATTANTITGAGLYVIDSPREVFAIQKYPIVSKTNNTFTYFHSNVDATASESLTETPGEVVKNSDGTMRVYFKSGWIG